MSFDEALNVAERLSPEIVTPTDCEPPPLSRPSVLPNAARAYRSGIHQGVDLFCPTPGRTAVAALDGRVVVAVADFQDPSPQDRDRLLDTAAALGATPPYTLVMLYGNYVVIDHGILDGVGHVVSLYAHLDEVDPGTWIGKPVKAGQPVGTIGNTGTAAGARRSLHEGLHLHWELHIDGQYLGVGLSERHTRAVYTALFS